MARQSFSHFYTSSEPAKYHKENRFEGKSNYHFYYPTGETYEQELEKFWFDAKNKELADKRREEEAREFMKEWGVARSRMEAEIARKKEHLTQATNFEKSRGWRRLCFKTKNVRPPETLEEFLALSSSEDEAAVEVSPKKNASPSPTKKQSIIHSAPQGPRVIDLTEDPNTYNFRPSTKQLADQMQAIDDYNNKLPPKKKAKESLPEISAPNVACKTLQVRDLKKKTTTFIKKYHLIGAVDDAKIDKN